MNKKEYRKGKTFKRFQPEVRMNTEDIFLYTFSCILDCYKLS